MILYDLTNGDPHTLKIDYRPQTCFLMTQLGGTVPPVVDAIRRDLGSVLDTHGFTLIDANSTITGRDFLTKIGLTQLNGAVFWRRCLPTRSNISSRRYSGPS